MSFNVLCCPLLITSSHGKGTVAYTSACRATLCAALTPPLYYTVYYILDWTKLCNIR